MAVPEVPLSIKRTQFEAADSNWTGLYKAGGVAALLTIVFFPIQILVFFINPPPETVIGWFTLFQNNRLIGFLDLDLLLIVDQALTILIFLALYAALRRAHESLMALGLALGLVSVVLFIASNPAFAMLSLSDQYAAAGTDAQRSVFLAAGQVMLVTWQGSSFHASYILGSIAAIIISVAMLRNRHFSKATPHLGILANVIALGLYVPDIGVYISIFSVVFLWVWYLLIAVGLIRLGRALRSDAN
jgi:hypothetical protein